MRCGALSRNVAGTSKTVDRRQKYTPSRIKLMLAAIRRGANMTAAASAVGVSRSRIYQWREQGRLVPEGIKFPPLGAQCIVQDGEERWYWVPNAAALVDMGGGPDPASLVTVRDEEWVDYGGLPLEDAITRAQEEYETYMLQEIQAAATSASKITFHYGPSGRLLRKVIERDWRAGAWVLEHHPAYKQKFASLRVQAISAAEAEAAEGTKPVMWEPDAEWMRKYVQTLREVGLIDELIKDGDASLSEKSAGETERPAEKEENMEP